MGNPYLNRDESIILTTHNVSFNSIVTEVIFTNQRLILFDSRHAQFRYQTIPLATIETVMIREDAESNPVIFLSIAPVTPDSPPQSKVLTFSKQAGGDRKQECVDWVKQLKDQIAAVRQQEAASAQPAPYHETDIIFDDISPGETEHVLPGSPQPEPHAEPHEPVITPPLKSAETETGQEKREPERAIPAAPGSEGTSVQDSAETTPAPPSPPPSPPPSAQPGKAKLIAVTAIVVIIALVAGAFIYSIILQGNEDETPVLPVTQVITPETTVIPTPTLSPSPTPPITILPTSQPTASIPEKGVWVKVQYTGNFTGRVGTAGNVKQVNASGDQYYQIPINDGIVEVLVQKEDGSGNMLVVEIYQNGKMVARSTKATPYGAIEVRETIKRG
ncbi:MAG: hypothetical protein LUQ36_08145 [Methanoregula sp.]|nr:hypothetical protein [Methanoregula sp.]